LDFAADDQSYDSFKLDRRMVAICRELRRVDWRTGRLLRMVADRRLHRLLGFRSVGAYARERLGLSGRTARQLVHIDRATIRLAQVGRAYRDGVLTAPRVMTILAVANDRNSSAWVDRAQGVTLRRLSDEVDWSLAVAGATGRWDDLRPPPLGAKLERPLSRPAAENDAAGNENSLEDAATWQICARSAEAVDSEIAFSGPASVVATFRTVIRAFAGRALSPWQGLERLLDHFDREWTRPELAHSDPVFARDGWRCTVPGCTARRELHDHHVVFRSRGGGDELDNKTSVCSFHHLHGIHQNFMGIAEPRVRVTGRAPEQLEWELGIPASGPPLFRLLGDVYLELR
jgi:hypothetical protein